MSEIWTIESVVEDFISGEKISRRKKAFLKNNHLERIGVMDYAMIHGNKWSGTVCPSEIVDGLNSKAYANDFPQRLDANYPYWDYAVAFALDLIRWDEKEVQMADEVHESMNDIDYQMKYFGCVFEKVIPSDF